MAEVMSSSGIGGSGSAQLLKILGDMFAGSGQKSTQQGTSTSTSTTSDTAIQALLSSLQLATSNATDPTITAGIVDDIMRKAAISFGPTQAAQHVAGIYGSTTMKQLSDEAQNSAAAAASQAVLNFKTSQQQIMEAAAGKLSDATRINTGSTSQSGTAKGSPVVPSSLSNPLAMLGAGYMGYKALAGTDGKPGSTSVGADAVSFLKKLVNGDSSGDAASVIESAGLGVNLAPHDAFVNASAFADASSALGLSSEALPIPPEFVSFEDATSSLSPVASALSEGSDVALSGGSDAISEVASTIGSTGGWFSDALDWIGGLFS